MADLEKYHQYGKELEDRLRLKTYPMALKLLEKEEDIPEGAMRPMRDLGKHVSMCQAIQVTRREGTTVAMLIEDHWCPEPVIGYGLGEPPEYFNEGYNRYPHDVKTLEAGAKYAEEFPKLEVGRCIGTVTAPLRSTSFEPDQVVIYCDSAQLSLLLLAREYHDGSNLKCEISSHAACVYGIVPAILNNHYQFGIPCRGDHYRAMAGDDEVIFTAAKCKMDDLMEGMRYLESTGSRLPREYTWLPEHPQRPSYTKIAKLMGYI